MLIDGERYFQVVEGYRLGHLTLHRPFERGSEPVGLTDVRHGATGMLLCTCPDFETTLALARVADEAIDWAAIRRRSDNDGNLIGSPLGWTSEKAKAVWRAMEPFDRLPLEDAPSVASFFNRPVTHTAGA